MTSRTRNILSGLTMIGALAALGWLIFVFGEIPAWFTRQYKVTVDMIDGGGLTVGSRVTLNGLDIGYIDTIQLKDDPTKGVVATALIQPGYKIPRYTKVYVASGVFGGAGQLFITAQSPPQGVTLTEENKFLPTDGTAQLTAYSDSFLARLEEAVNQRFDKFDKIADQISQLSEEYLAVGKNVNALLQQRSPEQVDAGEGPANVTTVLARADADLAKIQQTLDEINKVVSDKQLQADIRDTVANAKDATAGFKDVADEAKKLTQNADLSMQQLARRYIALADDMSKTLKQTDALLTEARTGEGTMGKLIKDPKLYDNLNDAASRLTDALKEAKLLIQKWKAEGLPVQF